MPISGSCQVCNNVTNSLMICVYCGAHVCVNCIDPRTGACVRCKGGVTRK